jgi:hypothetical protein
MKRDNEDLYRKVKLKEVLAPLSGRQKDIMESILQGYPTERLEESYKIFIPKVIKESVEDTKDTTILSESTNTTTIETTLLTGDEMINESHEKPLEGSTMKSEILRLAGLQ